MARKEDVSDRILSAALELAAIRGWRGLSLSEIAEEAGVPLADVYGAFPSKAAILAGIIGRFDRRVLAGGAADREESVRDRLFDVLMRRFDALSPHKDAVAAILRDLPADPATLLFTLPRLAISIAWMLEAAGLTCSGLRGAIRVKGVALIYLDTLRVWLRDDSEDMTRTMARLDRDLRRAEGLVQRCCRWERRSRAAADRGEGPQSEAPAEG
ncbi:MAG: TetR family transcriptional regulator [Rhodospirillales bacterium]